MFVFERGGNECVRDGTFSASRENSVAEKLNVDPYEFYGNKDSILNEVRWKRSVRDWIFHRASSSVPPRDRRKVRKKSGMRRRDWSVYGPERKSNRLRESPFQRSRFSRDRGRCSTNLIVLQTWSTRKLLVHEIDQSTIWFVLNLLYRQVGYPASCSFKSAWENQIFFKQYSRPLKGLKHRTDSKLICVSISRASMQRITINNRYGPITRGSRLIIVGL